MGYRVTLEGKLCRKKQKFHDNLDEALITVRTIFEVLREKNVDDSGINHRQVIIETADRA